MKTNSYRLHMQSMDAYSVYIFIILSMLLVGTISSGHAASPFANNIPASGPNACPANHKMYYIGRSPPTYTLKETRGLVWNAGNQDQDKFTFAENTGNKVFFMKFTGNDINSTRYGTKSPYYGDIDSVSSNAINFVHDSPAVIKTNNTVSLSSNWPISKIGFKIQDLDSFGTGNSLAYIEEARALNNGKISLAYTPPASPFHVLSQNDSVVSGVAGRNCGLNECTLDATWGYTPANTEIVLQHGNTQTSTNSVHAVGYSDFYYCLAPPRIVLQKALTGARVQATDQFILQITGNTTIPANDFTTTGSGSDIDNNDTATAVPVALNTTYTIVESVLGGGDILNYNSTYRCTNSTNLSNTNLSNASGTMNLNSSNNARSFTLSDLNYGDEITCTITNTPSAYTFTGTVFDDNGGIASDRASATNANITTNASPYFNNANYFNGIFDKNTPAESGISGSTVKLVNCATPSTVYGTQVVSTTGTYQISVPATTINSNSNNICLIEERGGNDYPIRTNNGNIKINITSNTYLYNDNDFGRVIPANAALVLEKEQAPNNCNITSLTDTSLKYSKSPLSSSGDNPDIRPGQCIAYRITATNRANISIDNFIMQDTLQRKGANNATVTSVLNNPARATGVFSDTLINGQNGTITTISQTLQKRDKRLFYFNTKYGSTVNAQ
ncbi:hypothetical protein [Psychrobacter immobilis]|uniref:hypothetical protein n=1 Tax=Psychrobacter TaxID=497 RepID=UPI001918A06E|nr:hypothetical protein [Psychrobacter immobilis]